MTDKVAKTGESAQALAQKVRSFTSGLSSISGGPGVLGIKKNITSAQSGLNVVFAFDTTGSMYPFFEQVKKSISSMVGDISQKVKKAKFGLVAWKNHGDESYFENEKAFLAVGLTENISLIKEAMGKVPKGGGGKDALTCLEDVFHYLNHEVGWESQAHKIVVLIGDMPPHGVLDPKTKCPFGYDWEKEVAELQRQDVKIYSVFCHEEEELSSRINKVKEFFKGASSTTDGKFLELAEIDDITDVLVGICLKLTGHLDDFIEILEARDLLTPSKREILFQLKGGGSNA